MTPAARIQATIELLALTLPGTAPADAVLDKALRGRRYMGAKDRRAVTARVWRIWRRRARYGWWLEHLEAAGAMDEARGLVLVDVVIEDGADPADEREVDGVGGRRGGDGDDEDREHEGRRGGRAGR